MNASQRRRLSLLVAVLFVSGGAAVALVGVFMVGGLGWALIVAGAGAVATGLLGIST